jgi:PAS domain S-box-containing protein
MKQFPFSSLRARLFFLVLLAVLPALALTLYTALEERQQAALRAQEDALRLVRLAESNQVRLIEETRQLLMAMAQLPQVQDGRSAQCNRFFDLLLKEYPLYANLGAINLKGQVFCSAVPTRRSINLANRPFFQKAVKTSDFIMGNFRIGQITNKGTMDFGYPVLSQSGQVRAIVFAALDLSWLHRLLTEAQFPKGSTLTVVDRNGTILARYPNPEGWIGQTLPEVPMIKVMLKQQKEGTAEVPGLDGIRRLFAFTVLRGASQEEDVYVSIGIPSSVAFAKADHILKRNLVVLGLVAILGLLVAWLWGNLFVLRQINALLRATQKLSTGDLGVRTELPYHQGELGQLARAFDQMAESLEQRVAERRRAEKALLESEECYRTVAETASDGILTIDRESRIVFVNRAAERIFGYSREEMLGQPLTLLMPMRLRNLHQASVQRYMDDGRRHISWQSVEMPGLHKSGREISLEISLSEDFKGGKPYVTGFVRDVTGRKQAAEQLRSSLKEKEVLLQEIHHRVKNNLQIISSLLNLQTGYVKDKKLLEMFAEYQARVKSMALIHEQLYESKDLAKIDFAVYIQKLVINLFRLYGIDADAITLEINVDGGVLDVDLAVPCGLMITELVSNSLKYAFPVGQPGKICIDLRSDRDHGFTLSVGDDGVGFPENLDFRNTESLGLQLVNTLTAQLGGTLTLDRQGGTKFEIKISTSKHKARNAIHV